MSYHNYLASKIAYLEKELKVYDKALKLACGRLSELSTPSEKFLFDLYLKKAREEYFLQKAREEYFLQKAREQK